MLKTSDVLSYSKGRRPQDTVKRHYLKWRESCNPSIPLRCDNKKCKFYIKPLVWNNKDLKLILDHINGVHGDNRPKNLRFLCPNCNAQLNTQGGANKGRVEQSVGGFCVKDKKNRKNYVLPCETGFFKIK